MTAGAHLSINILEEYYEANLDEDNEVLAMFVSDFNDDSLQLRLGSDFGTQLDQTKVIEDDVDDVDDDQQDGEHRQIIYQKGIIMTIMMMIMMMD